MKKIFIIILSVISISVFGQDFNYKASVEKVNSDAFYKILLQTDVTSKLNSSFSDARLYDSADTEIPYILYKESRTVEKELFVEYEIIVKEHIKSHNYTRIVIRNPQRTKINNIVLRIKNADVRKQLKLNASYDNENWFVLKDNYYYNSINNTENTSEIRVLNFPLSDYEYYELLVGDFFDKPINITQAGYYNRIKENGKYTELANISFTVVDTLKETVIAIPINGNYFDKIAFDIDAPKYFRREAEILINKSNYKVGIASFTLISNSYNVFSVNNIQGDTLWIRIKNNDNIPLNIKSINLYQLNKYITAELGTSNSYVIRFSDDNAEKPNYDLAYFSDSIPDNLKVVSIENINEITKPIEIVTDSNFELEDYWLWIITIAMVLLLAYMSFKMISDNKAKQK